MALPAAYPSQSLCTAALVVRSSLLPQWVEAALEPLQSLAATPTEAGTSEAVEQRGSPSRRVIRISVLLALLPRVAVLIVRAAPLAARLPGFAKADLLSSA